MITKQKENTTLKAVERIQNKNKLLFMNKENRDTAFKLILKDLNTVAIKKSNISNQQTHPEYIEDYKGLIETGFGNDMYKTFFKKLYKIEIMEFN